MPVLACTVARASGPTANSTSAAARTRPDRRAAMSFTTDTPSVSAPFGQGLTKDGDVWPDVSAVVDGAQQTRDDRGRAALADRVQARLRGGLAVVVRLQTIGQ